MESVGIIAEYNPFHNGHLYHLNEIKKMYPDNCIVLVMSSSFSQRGEPSIIDKWKKTEIALQAGIDLVIELPFVFSTESADIFAYGAITLLEKLKVKNLVFGSETNDINKFNTIVDTQLNNEEFDPLVKIYMKMGENYPTALSKSLLDLTGNTMTLPNDLLGISYVKTIKSNNYKITPHCIKRTNSYHNENLNNELSSASAIRKALEENKDIKNQVPTYTEQRIKEDLHFQKDYFKFLKYKIMLEENLNIYQTVDEGLGEKIKKEIINATSYDDLIEKVKSKRYTYNKINRMLTHILCGFTKEDKQEMKELEYIRVLGFSEKGRDYLNKIKKEVDLPIISNFSKSKSKMLNLEFKATCVYASTLSEEKKKALIEKEYKYHPMKGVNKNDKIK